MMKRSFIVALLTISLMNCTTQESQQQDEFQISWNLKTNFVTEEGGHKATFSITNNSDTTLGNDQWQLFWNMMPRSIVEDSIDGPVSIEWINGDFYKMDPTSEFILEPGQTLNISYVGEGSVIKETDAPLGLYFVFYNENGNETKRLSINDYTIKPFTNPEQINRSAEDEVPIPTTELRYEQNEYLSLIPEDQLLPIIPTPTSMEKDDGTVPINSNTIIQYAEGLENEAELLATEFNNLFGKDLQVQEGTTPSANAITLNLSSSGQPEAYQLNITPDRGIEITSNDPAGVFYGTRSLLALIPAEAYGTTKQELQMPQVQINDDPAFGYRGIHLDVARNFNSKATIKKLISVMALYKLNKLHLHLTEDEAWRIEIEELPELTEFGAYRGHTLNDEEHLPPAYGSGPFPNPDKGYGSGYYSREDYKEILQYAKARHIEVIPEINVPGHSRAAVKAMEYRYRKLMEEGKQEEAEKYRLADPNDESEYSSAQSFTDNVICVCQPSALKFYETVIDDIIEMYDEAKAPLNMIHTGGDEVPHGAWAGSPICQEFLETHQEIDHAQNLQKYFFRQVNNMLKEKGFVSGGWEEVSMDFHEGGGWSPNTEFSGGQVVPYIWNSIWGNQDLGYKLANAGYPVVLCNVSNYYFDLAYNKDPKEPGLYWGGLVDARDAFEYAPYDLFKTTLKDVLGRKIDTESYRDMEKLRPEARGNILGIQAQLWSETIKGEEMLEYYYLPKMFGLAERAWAGQANWADIEDVNNRKDATDEAWNRFINSVTRREFARLDQINGGYNYRIALPGAIVEDNVLHANVAYPGLEIRYTTDGSEPDKNATLYQYPAKVEGEVIKLKAFNRTGRSSRTSEIQINQK